MVRFKHRYLLAEILYDGAHRSKVAKGAILEALREGVRTLVGDFGHAVIGQVLQSTNNLI